MMQRMILGDLLHFLCVYSVLLFGFSADILLLNMLIVLMGNTVERISTQSENIRNLPRVFTILDMERTLPRWLRSKLQCRMSRMVCSRNSIDKHRRFFRVEEMNWKQWRSDLGVHWEEEPANDMMVPQPRDKIPGNPWKLNMLLQRIRYRRQERQQSNIPKINQENQNLCVSVSE